MGGDVAFYFEELFADYNEGLVLNRQYILSLLGSLESLRNIKSKDISLVELCRDKEGVFLGFAAIVHFHSGS